MPPTDELLSSHKAATRTIAAKLSADESRILEAWMQQHGVSETSRAIRLILQEIGEPATLESVIRDLDSLERVPRPQWGDLVQAVLRAARRWGWLSLRIAP